MPPTHALLVQLLQSTEDENPARLRRRVGRLASLARVLTAPDHLRDVWKGVAVYVPVYDRGGTGYLGQRTDPRAESRVWRVWRPVVEAPAGNPNTPPEVLSHLAYHAPLAFSRNPVAPLLTLENPFWVDLLRTRKQPYGNATIMRLLRCEEAPASLVNFIASGTVIPPGLATEEASLHVSTAGEAGPQEWLSEVRDYWREGSEQWVATDAELFREFGVAGILPAWAGGGPAGAQWVKEARERFLAASDLRTPAEELARSAHSDESWLVRLAASLNPSAPAQVRERLRRGELGLYVGVSSVADLLNMARGYGHLRSEEKLRNVCQELLWRVAKLDRSEIPLWHLHGDVRKMELPQVKAHLMRFFLRVLLSPSMVRDPARSQEVGEHWVPLLAWALGVQPGAEGTWGRREAEGLRSLTRDGNRWVRAAARAKHEDPGFTFSW